MHDFIIEKRLNDLSSERCQEAYEEIEKLFCVSCDPKQANYLNFTLKTFRICKSYADRLWNDTSVPNGTPLTAPTTRFDSCGFRGEGVLKKLVPTAKLEINETDIIPSKVNY